MGEKKPVLDELSQRIDELLNVLKMVSGDLAEISKTIKDNNPQASVAQPTLKSERIEEIKATFPRDSIELLNFEETETYIIVKARQYLGAENFAKIASIIRDMDGEYISAGRDSHFRIPKDSRQNG